ncbi:hypothetical protein CLM74_08095 [Stenotrophomonas sp. MYb57]|uniref:hypothetical protein n=1 Tax=Stenotrophomonas sp. MYb57 TaxID=1827305 RepID=UPI000CF680E6|nr:hypothetical protein [Stenotrophomonas sp. MYb57]AVJ32734.1 hypothetical protein CLM74_08095 [Stenotrophomonas sp. MYb57]
MPFPLTRPAAAPRSIRRSWPSRSSGARSCFGLGANGSRSTTTTDLSGRKRTTHSDGSYSNSSTDLSGNIRTQYSDGSYSVSKRDLSGRWRTEYSDGSYTTSVRDLSGNWSTTSSGGMAARHPERGVGKR